MLSLTIHHNIHLTREEIYALHDGEDIVTTGCSVPVWFYHKFTSEPAKEVFCRYILKNPKKEIPIQILENGYEIYLPYREGTKLNISDEEWKHLKLHNPDKLEELYKKLKPEISSKNLLDFKDGGGQSLSYREFNKVKKNKELLEVMHYVCVSNVDLLTPTLQKI